MLSYFSELLSSSPVGSIDLILLCLLVGFVIAGILAIIDRRVMGAFVRTLLKMGATSPETAVTLREAGFEKKRAVISGLRGKGIFSGTVFEASEQVEFDREDHALPIHRARFDTEKARFYIPEPLRHRAAIRFESKGNHVVILIIGTLLLLVLLLLAMLYKDHIIQLVNQYLGSMSK